MLHTFLIGFLLAGEPVADYSRLAITPSQGTNGLVVLERTTEPITIKFMTNGTEILSVKPDGSVTFAPGVTPDAAAQHFWDAVSKLAYRDHVYQTNRQEVIEVLKGCERKLQPYPDAYMTLEYRSPANELRRQADAIEAREAFAARLSRLIDTLEPSTNRGTILLPANP